MSAIPASFQSLPLMMGIPDNRLIGVGPGPRGTLAYIFHGNSRIATDLAPQFKQRLLRIFFGPKIPVRMPPDYANSPLINAVSDPDISSISLHMLEQLLDETGVGCFNHPRAVHGSGRDRVAAKLADIPGVQMPRTIKLRVDEPDDLIRAAQEHGLQWPLIVRVAGTHRGSATALAEAPDKLKQALHGMAWGGHDLYMTEYVDCRDDDGHYRKLRLVVVGNEIFLRHLVIANSWLVHAHDRELGHLDEEIATLCDFPSDLLPKIRTTMLAVADAMDMDYFGMDCSVRPDGRLLVFEVNVMMDILVNTMASPNCWDEPIARIHEALTALLFAPERWRHAGRIATPA